MKQYHFYILFLIVIAFACNSQKQSNPQYVSETNEEITEEKTTEAEQAANQFKSYNAGDIVSEGYLDQAGNMWFTTTGDGIYKYNEATFINITTEDGLCSNEVNAVIEDENGLLWFATDKGLCSYDGQHFQSIPLPTDKAQDVSPKTGFPSRQTQNVLNIAKDSKGNLWLGTDASGAYRFDEKVFTSFLKYEGRLQSDSVYNNCITSILEDSKGNIWFTSMTHGGISRYDGQEFIHFNTENGLNGDMMTASFEDQSGNLWFGSIQNLEGGLLRFDGENFRFYSKKDGLCDSNVTCFYEDETGKIWLGTGNGVCYYDGKTFTPFENNGQSLGDIRFIVKDNAGHLWFGGRYGVLYKYDGKELKDFTQLKNKTN